MEIDAYIRGYAVVPAEFEVDLPWRHFALGTHFKIHAHPKTEVVVAHGRNTAVCLVGRAYDLDNGAKTAACAQEALTKLQDEGFTAALRYIAYLGGRFAAFVADGDTLHAVPDCHATYAIYSFPLDGMHAFCSHWMLASELGHFTLSTEVAEFFNSDAYREPGGKYYPALWTPFAEVSCVFPNCSAAYNVDTQRFTHERFYPFAALPTRSASSAYPEFARLLRRSVEFAATEQIALGITNGGDSRTVLAALPRPYPHRAFSFTYARLSALTEDGKADLVGGNAIAFRAGLPHRVLDLLPVDYTCAFHQLYARSFRHGANFPTLARLYFEELPHNCTIMISLVAETGTVFYKIREFSSPTGEILAAKFTTSPAKELPVLINAFDAYIEYTAFTTDRLFNFDWHDLFYWEHRNVKWASRLYAEADMTGFAIAPYNCRRLIEVMLSIPLEERDQRYLQMRFINESGLA